MTTDERWQLVWPHYPRAVRIARSRTPTQQDAEDVAMLALLSVVEYDALDPDRVGQLISSVVIRECADAWRRRTAAAKRDGIYFASNASLAAAFEDDLCDADEARRRVAAMNLRGLAARERDVLFARADGYSPAEIADRLGVTYKAVERAMLRARRKLATTVAVLIGLAANLRRGLRASAVAVAPVCLALLLAPLLRLPPDTGTDSTVEGASPPPAPITTVADTARPARPAPAEAPSRSRPISGAPAAQAALPAAPKWTTIAPGIEVAPGVKRDPVRVTGPGEPIRDRVARCVENGVEVSVDPGNGWMGAVCRETPAPR